MNKKDKIFITVYAGAIYFLLVALFALLDALPMTDFGNTDLAWMISAVSATMGSFMKLVWNKDKDKDKEK